MLSNQDAFRNLLLIAFETALRLREKKQKTIISDQFFHFHFLQSFGNLKIGFDINVNKCF